MTAPQWVLFLVGLVFLFSGAALMVYGALLQSAKAGLADTPATTAKALADAFATVGATIIKMMRVVEKSRARGIGLLLVFVGLAMILMTFFIPGLRAA
jgi:hypothetical protein